MVEKRKKPRLDEQNEADVTVVSAEYTIVSGKFISYNIPKKKIIGNLTINVSEGGAKIQTHVFLPVDTVIQLEFTSKGIQQPINTLGKVKWINTIVEDWSYEAGIEFCDSSIEAIQKLGEYITKKTKHKK